MPMITQSAPAGKHFTFGINIFPLFTLFSRAFIFYGYPILAQAESILR